MTPLEAWSVISKNLTELCRFRSASGGIVYGPSDTEAEVIAFLALREMQERKYAKPLKLDELLLLIDEPVWVEYLDSPKLSGWGIVEGCSELGGKEYLYLRGDLNYCVYNKEVVAYRYKPAGGERK